MSPLSSAVITGGIVTVANLIQKKGITFRQVAGIGIYAILLAGVNEVDQGLAQKFAVLVMVGVMLLYVPGVVNGLGIGQK